MVSFPFRASILIGFGAFFAAHAGFSLADDRATGGGITRLIDAQLKKRTSSDEIVACEVTYNIGYEDHVYRKGGVVLLRGSVSINRAIQKTETLPYVILKMAALDFDGDTFTMAPMNYAFLSAGGRSYAHKEVSSFRCEDEGLCAVYNADAELARAIGGSFEISYNRAPGGSDVTVPVNLLRTRPQLAAGFTECTTALFGSKRGD